METTSNTRVCASRTFGRTLVALAFLPFLLFRTAASQTTYTITDLGTLGGTFGVAGVVTNSGAVGGNSTLIGDAVIRGFLWTGGSLIDLGSLPAGPNVVAQNANERLRIAGGADGASTDHDANACWCPSNLDCHSFLWQNGVMTDLGTMGGNSSFAQWINNRGQIVGLSQINAIDPNGEVHLCGAGPGNQMVRPYLFENGKFQELGTLGGYNAAALGINDSGQVSGGSEVTTSIDPTVGFVPHDAFLWSKGVMTDLGTLGGKFSFGVIVSNRGDVVGGSSLAGEEHTHGFLWQNGALIDLGVLAGDTDSQASGINTFGQVVGLSWNSNGMRGFIWQNRAMTDLNTLISPSSGFQVALGAWINDGGEIAAQALVESTGEMHAVLLTPSNNSVRGNSVTVPLTDSLRKLLLQKYGYSRMKFLTSGQ